MEFPHLASTNKAPLEAEAQQILALIKAAQAQPAAQKADLKNEDTEFAQRIRALRSIVSPVRRIPPEILSHILILATDWAKGRLPGFEEVMRMRSSWFSAASGDNEQGSSITRWTNGAVFLEISQICSPWRAVAHATPKLWTSLVFKLNGPREDDSEVESEDEDGLDRSPYSAVSMMQHFARLSQPHGLDLRLSINDTYAAKPLVAVWGISRQVAALKLDVHVATIMTLVGLAPDAFPLLENLDINLRVPDSIDWEARPEGRDVIPGLCKSSQSKLRHIKLFVPS
ncbi:F-box domain-containing protein [Mycena chlorophos]|uniref:F-box domain-containing protein n=1 Tax=Mycena chlorophos TaxID=658473 RepID=A0A8H6TL28_MYCCL|nr:F-box domain-containing protein [Mycena chlorophos]